MPWLWGKGGRQQGQEGGRDGMACPPGRGGREFGDSLKPPGFYFDHSVHLTEEEDSGRRQVWKAVGSVCLFGF